MNNFVIDNSFLINALGLDNFFTKDVKEFIEGEFQIKSNRFFAPNIIKYELISALYQKVNKDQDINLDSIFRDFHFFNIECCDFTYSELKEIINISSKHNKKIKSKNEFLTTYDASYLYLSKKLNAKLLTEDNLLKKFQKKV